MLQLFLLVLLIFFQQTVISSGHEVFSKNNCSRSFIDKPSASYMAYFSLYSFSVNSQCKRTKIVHFKMYSSITAVVDVEVLSEVWDLLNVHQKKKLSSYVLDRLYVGCNSVAMPADLCRTAGRQEQHRLLGGAVHLRAYDGTWNRNKRICSLCLLSPSNRSYAALRYGPSNTPPSKSLRQLHLPLSRILQFDQLTSAADNIVSMKIDRADDNRAGVLTTRLGSVVTLLGNDGARYSGLPLVAALVYKFEVKLASQIRRNKNSASERQKKSCLLQCGWTGNCLHKWTDICNGVVDCSDGYDEAPHVCQHFRSRAQFDAVKDGRGPMQGSVTPVPPQPSAMLLLTVVLLCVVIVIAVFTVTLLWHRQRRHSRHCGSNGNRYHDNRYMTSLTCDSFMKKATNKHLAKSTSTSDSIMTQFWLPWRRLSKSCGDHYDYESFRVQQKQKMVSPPLWKVTNHRCKCRNSIHLSETGNSLYYPAVGFGCSSVTDPGQSMHSHTSPENNNSVLSAPVSMSSLLPLCSSSLCHTSAQKQSPISTSRWLYTYRHLARRLPRRPLSRTTVAMPTETVTPLNVTALFPSSSRNNNIVTTALVSRTISSPDNSVSVSSSSVSEYSHPSQRLSTSSHC